MDQDRSGKGSGGDRRNWRERLGINQELPRLSEEFRSDNAQPRAEPKLEEDRQQAPAPRPAQPARATEPTVAERPGKPVVRPAPMAPRPAAASAPAASRPEPQPRPAEPQQPAPQPQRAEAQAQRQAPQPAPQPQIQRSIQPPQRPQPPSEPAGRQPPARQTAPTQPPGETRSDQFAERLKAQREAAERLAKQRMQQPRTPPPQPSRSAPSQQPPGGPKFTLAPEEIMQAQREVTPTRAPAPPPPTQASGGYGYPPPAQPYGRVPPPAYQPGAYQPRPYSPDYRPGGPGSYPEPAPQARRDWREEPAGERRRGAMPAAEDEAHEPERGPSVNKRGLAAPRVRSDEYAADDLDDVFEDDRSPRRARARAEDYSAAYRGYEDDFEEDEEPRSRGGPLVLLLALVAVALIIGGLIYWYVSQKQQIAGQGANVPVITAPQEPVKTAPEPAAQQQASQDPNQAQPAAQRKQIYDRILGEETLEPERIVPTEEQPQALPGQSQGSDQGTGSQQQSTEPLPLPLPPPPEPSGQQGNLQGPQSVGKTEPDQVAGLNPSVVAEPASQSGSDLVIRQSDVSADRSLDLTVPEVPTQQQAEAQAEQPPPSDQAIEANEQQQLQQIIETDQAPAKVAKAQKQKAVEKPQPVVEQEQVISPPPPQPPVVQQPTDQGNGPIALVPPTDSSHFAQPINPDQQIAATREAEAPVRTNRPGGRESDPLEGKRVPFSSTAQTVQTAPQQSDLTASLDQQPVVPQTAVEPQPVIAPQVQQPVVQPQQQVASIEQPQQVENASSGYVIQLAAFRSETDARNEYLRLAQRHASLLNGLAPQFQQASLGASGSFYRLTLGTLPSSNDAAKLCNSLIAAGEKDCLVRRQ